MFGQFSEAAPAIQSIHNDPPSVSNSPSSPKQHFHRQYSVRPNASIAPPQPPPRHHRSMSSLIGIEIGGITAEMLRVSTPIEYPAGEEPGVILKNAEQQKGKPTNAASNERKQQSMSKSPPTRATILHHSRFPQPTTSSKTFSVESRNSPPSLPLRMDIGRIEPSLAVAASSPIPNHLEKSKLSHIPILTSNSSPLINGGGSKIPPPVAPKPKVVASNGFNGANYVNTSSHEHQAVEQQSSTCSPSFSNKLKLFEQMQTTNNGPMAANGLGGEKEDAAALLQIGSTAKPSGIPLKKPLVSAHDLEKLREAEEKKRSKMDPQLRNEGEEEVDDEDEHRDTVKELSRLLAEQQNGGGFPSPIGPSVIRTKKAELRAERAASAMENMMNSSNGSGRAEDGGSMSRASSSLSQRAAEIEKRREWRQARLQSMDVESKRRDDLVISDIKCFFFN